MAVSPSDRFRGRLSAEIFIHSQLRFAVQVEREIIVIAAIQQSWLQEVARLPDGSSRVTDSHIHRSRMTVAHQYYPIPRSPGTRHANPRLAVEE